MVVGGAGSMFSLLRSLAPGLAERMMARRVEEKHLSRQPAEPTSGNLFWPLPALNEVSGGWLLPGSRVVRRAVTAGAVVLVPAVVGWLWLRFPNNRARRRQLAWQREMARIGWNRLRRAA
jgi:hypothetical protein